jgi:solute carrier family 8 (sodium/calcium exchanger)
MLEYILQQKEATWAQQFKIAVILGPTIDEENEMDEVTGFAAFSHFIAIGWNVFFAIIPPRRYCHGWLAFFFALASIGLCTAIVAEFANLLGCCVGLKSSITAITLVALGTSLPDTLASKISAQQAPNADPAIGNITGSNSVNVFLGLGLPWVFATLYRKNTTGEDYAVPSGELAFSVMLFLATAVCCFGILIIRRSVSVLISVTYLGFRWRIGWSLQEQSILSRLHVSSLGDLHFVFDPAGIRIPCRLLSPLVTSAELL